MILSITPSEAPGNSQTAAGKLSSFPFASRLLADSHLRETLCEDAQRCPGLSSYRPMMSDREKEWVEFMQAANRGCKPSYSRLLTALASALPRIISPSLARLGLPNSDTEDVVQEVLLAIHSKRHTWDEGRPFTPWLRAIVRHKVFDLARQRYKQSEAAVASALDLTETTEEPRSMILVERHVEGLPKQQRNVVRALVFEGASVQETANRLKISKNAVYVTLHRAAKGLATKFGLKTHEF